MTQLGIIAGLGNPEDKYDRTLHNAGFWFVDTLARELGVTLSPSRKLHGDVGEASIAAHRVRLLKPSTFMNRSGLAVGAAIRYYKIAPENVLVVYDEIDFPPGKIRLKFGGGHAGHNDIRDVIEHVGREFWRLRLGVGHPGHSADVVNHVLKPATRDDEHAIRDTIRRGIETLPILIEHGGTRAQHALHTEPSSTEPDDGD